MKRTIPFIFLSALAVYAPAATKKSTPAAPTRQAVTIPKDAVQNPDGTYTYTDKQGRKWLYNKTPFGLMKIPFTDTSAPAPMDATKVVDKGDVIAFEHPTPFGMMRWEKKRAELTEDERRLLEAQKESQPDTEKAKPE